MAGNPKHAIDAVLDGEREIGGLTVKPLTLARWALLEKVESPLLGCQNPGQQKDGNIEGLMISLYIMCAEVEDLVGKTKERLENNAYAWADSVPMKEMDDALLCISDAMNDVQYLSPDGKEDDKKKEATSPQTDG